MSYSTEDQAIALAAVFQAANLVDRLAKTGSIPDEAFKVLLQSLLTINSDSTLDIYGDRYSIQYGLRELINVLGKKNERDKVEVVRYSLTLLYLEGKLNKRPDLLRVMSERLAQIQSQADHFSPIHPTIIAAFASLYKDTVSTFPQRIQVTGESKFLKVDENADKIRALLLAGVRAAVLWRQVGGRRWKLLFMRKPILRAAKALVV